jgi:hypothetical protein
MLEAFYDQLGDDTFAASHWTIGPWSADFQHGGPPAALVVRTLVARLQASQVAKVDVALLRPVPVGKVRVDVTLDRPGRSLRHLEGTLSVGDRVVMRVGVMARVEVDVGLEAAPTVESWPRPEGLDDFVFPFFQTRLGYHGAVQLRRAAGVSGTTPVGYWARSRMDLVAGDAITPLEQVLVLADAQSGMGPPLDPAKFSFVNPDMVLHLARPLVAGWVGFDIRSATGSGGAGWSASEIRDERGLVGRSVQSLVVQRR